MITGGKYPVTLPGNFSVEVWQRLAHYCEDYIIRNESSTSEEILSEVEDCKVILKDIMTFVLEINIEED